MIFRLIRVSSIVLSSRPNPPVITTFAGVIGAHTGMNAQGRATQNNQPLTLILTVHLPN